MNFERTLEDSKKLHEELLLHKAALTPQRRLIKRRYALRAYKRVYSKLKRNHEDQAAKILSGIIIRWRLRLTKGFL